MSNFETILSEWRKTAEEIKESDWMSRLLSGELDIRHYKGFLLETYHHAGLNPQIQAYCTMFLRDNPREIIRMFFRHADSEIGHDLMALNDLEALGESKERMIETRPLPETVAFNAYVLYSIQFVDPLSYLGYLFHLEFLPTQQGDLYIKTLKSMGAPENSLTFLEEHATVDEGHNKMMKNYISQLVDTPKKVGIVMNAIKDSAVLHKNMIEAAMANGEKIF